MDLAYIDTSALAKWYVDEARSDDVEKFIIAEQRVGVSRLTLVEMRSTMARRRRQREMEPDRERAVMAALRDDVHNGFLVHVPMDEDVWQGAALLIDRLPEIPLRTLDALHLAALMDAGCRRLVTADKVVRRAGRALKLEVLWFG